VTVNPPAYSVGGTWVLNIDMMTQPQVPPPAHLTMVVFRDGRNYLVFPHIELTLVSLQDGVYDLNIAASKVHPFGVPGINMAGNSSTTFHRLFLDEVAEPGGSLPDVLVQRAVHRRGLGGEAAGLSLLG